MGIKFAQSHFIRGVRAKNVLVLSHIVMDYIKVRPCSSPATHSRGLHQGEDHALVLLQIVMDYIKVRIMLVCPITNSHELHQGDDHALVLLHKHSHGLHPGED